MRYHRLLGIAALLVFAGCAEGTMGDGPVCGDDDCNGDETRSTCPQDCAPAQQAVCGDGTCNGTETVSSCAQDCNGTTTPVCGDGTCNGTENAASCAQDCGGGTASCGDSVCNGGETSTSCPVDCPAQATCGDLVCAAGEDVSCPGDCGGGGGAGCGDLVCDVAGGECESLDFNCIFDCSFDDVCGGGGGGGTCDHDVCTTGTALDASCGTCAQEMCDYDSYCCTDEWDSFCVDQVNTVCTTETCP